jgi:hypothetical protein
MSGTGRPGLGPGPPVLRMCRAGMLTLGEGVYTPRRQLPAIPGSFAPVAHLF